MNNNRWFLIVVGIFVAIPGIIFTGLMWRSASRAFEMDQWIETPCYIQQSKVVHRQISNIAPEFSYIVKYTFDFDGEKLTSQQFELRGQKWTKDANKLRPYLEKFPRGSQQTCFVNPTNSSISVLKKDSKAPLYSIWFPILFVVGGLGMAITSAFKKSRIVE